MEIEIEITDGPDEDEADECPVCGADMQDGEACPSCGYDGPVDVQSAAYAARRMEFRDFSDKIRADYASKGWALSDGSYPIPDIGALKRAIQSFGRAPASHKQELRALIVKRAKELGVPDMAANFSTEQRIEAVEQAIVTLARSRFFDGKYANETPDNQLQHNARMQQQASRKKAEELRAIIQPS
jgi:hypothetical protein